MKLVEGGLILMAAMLLCSAVQPATGDCPPDDFDARHQRVEQRITDAVAQGKLSEREAGGFRRALARIARDCQKCRNSKGLSSWEVSMLVREFDRLNWRLSRRLKTSR
jgi:hypothetical protein